MKILTIIELAASADVSEVRRNLNAELRESWKLFSEDILREAYTTDDSGRVVFVLEAIDRAAAETELRRLPLVKLGYFSVRLIELRPFSNWARLFSEPV
jgi:hypothetical protein